MALWMDCVCCWISCSFSLMKLMAKSGEPTGVPSSQKLGLGFVG